MKGRLLTLAFTVALGGLLLAALPALLPTPTANAAPVAPDVYEATEVAAPPSPHTKGGFPVYPGSPIYYWDPEGDTYHDFASEDIGMAQPTALVVANEVFRACETIGYPECAINLAHGVVYLAKAPKDRSAYDGLRAAQEDVKKHSNLPIPMSIRNAPTKLMKDLGYGKGYEPYPKGKSLLPHKLKGRSYYSKKKLK